MNCLPIQKPDQKEKEKKNIPGQTSPDQLFAANFIPADDYEALVGTTFRSNTINILGPEAGLHFQKEELITFSWDLKNSEFLYITILNNREEIVSRQEISVPRYETSKISTPGLYYWKLENEEELLYVGKFYIDN
jgi:predicted secreted protein